MAPGIKPEVVWVVCIVAGLANNFVIASRRSYHTGKNMSLEEKAGYHFVELRDTLIKMDAFTNEGSLGILKAVLNKRSSNQTDAALSNLVLSSLSSLCHSFNNVGEGSETNINIFNNSTVNIVTRTKKNKESTRSKGREKEKKGTETEGEETSGFTKFLPLSGEHYSPKSKVFVRPLKVTARLDGDLVTVTFNVSRAVPALVTHTWSYDGKRETLKGPRTYGLDARTTVSSSIDFAFNASACRKQDKYGSTSRKQERFHFQRKESGDPIVVVVIPKCLFAVQPDGEKGKDKSSEMSQEIRYPKYWEDLHLSNLTTSRRKNVSFAFNISLGNHDGVLLYGAFYDPTKDMMWFSNTVILSKNVKKIVTESISSEENTKVLSVEIEKQEELSGEVPGLEKLVGSNYTGTHTVATIRVIVSLPNDKVSGQLFFENEVSQRRFIEERGHGVVFSINMKKQILILPPKQEQAFPVGKYLLTSPKSFSCRDDGRSNDGIYEDPTSCVAVCAVFGRGIRTMRIRNIKGGVVPVRKYVEVNSNFAMVYADLGPKGKEADGVYECRAVGQDGKRQSWKVPVVSWGFIDDTSVNFTTFGKTAMLECEGSSPRQRPEISVHMEGEGRIDLNPQFERVVDTQGQKTTMALYMPVSYLRYPRYRLACHVKNDFDEKKMYRFLSSYLFPGYYYRTDHPYVLKNESEVTDNLDGTATFRCVATGKQPMHVNFYLDTQWLGFANKDGGRSSSWDGTQVGWAVADGEMTATVILPTSYLRPPNDFAICGAYNDVGGDRFEIKLADVIQDYYSSSERSTSKTESHG